MTIAAVVDDLVAELGPRAVPEASLAEFTTYRVGGPARALVTVHDEETLHRFVGVVAGRDVPVRTLGRGSNLLIADRGFDGIVVRLVGYFEGIGIDGTTVVCGAGAKLPVVARTSVQHDLTGFEWAVGVPGSVGGAVRMNAGGHGSDMSDAVLDVDVVDLVTGDRRSRPTAELDFGYRHSAIAFTDLVVGCRLGLAPSAGIDGKAKLASIVQWRRAHQPGGQNAGSVFTNPEGDSAGRLIDTAGGKGLRIGTAEVSSKHANFIQADEGGRADDVLAVMRAVRELVADHHGVTLRPETHLVGFTPEELAWLG